MCCWFSIEYLDLDEFTFKLDFLMGFKKWVFTSLLKKSFLIKILDSVFFFSTISIEKYFQSMEMDRRIKSVKLAERSLGLGFPKGNSLGPEQWFIENILKEVFRYNEQTIIVDVGANVGEYCGLMKKNIHKKIIYCLEPNPFAYSVLKKKFSNDSNIKVFNIGLADFAGKGLLYTHSERNTSAHSTLVEGIIENIYDDPNVLEVQVNLTTLNEFMISNKLDHVDFIKIDTEGFEYSVLIGGLEFINKSKIFMIQFEFNEMNVYKKIFLKDFYTLLSEYYFFRISDGELIDINEYKTENEIFWYQDILCVLKTKEDYIKSLRNFVAI